MSQANPPSRSFVVTSQGASATRWLAFVLASHPKVFVAHGHFALDSVADGKFQEEKSKDDTEALSIGNATRDLYETNKISDIFSAYRDLKPDADIYGNIHSYTLDRLLEKRAESPFDPVELAVANLVRHPISYIESHCFLVRKAERYPAVYQSYSVDLFPKALQEFRELFLVDCSDFREFLAFVVSCYSALNVAHDLAYDQVRHFRMEAVTTDATALSEFCQILTGLSYRQDQLDSFIASGAINRHRRGSESTDPWQIYREWPCWKQDIVSMMLPDAVLARFADAGYDVGILRGGAADIGRERVPVPCLADALGAMDQAHPLLMALTAGAQSPRNEGYRSEPKLLESCCGYNIVQLGGKFIALSQSLGDTDVTEDAEVLIERHGSRMVIVTDTVESARARAQELADTHEPVQLLASYGDYNLVSYDRRFYGLKQSLGPVDVTVRTQALIDRYGSNTIIITTSAKAARARIMMRLLADRFTRSR
jgi:hypothetical protein